MAVEIDRVVRETTGGRLSSWDDLLARWERFVGEVETAYEFSMYDYHNDLDIRGLIQDVLDRLPTDQRETFVRAVQTLDNRFLDATFEVPEVVATRNLGAWARRVPLRPGLELQTDMVNRGWNAPAET